MADLFIRSSKQQPDSQVNNILQCRSKQADPDKFFVRDPGITSKINTCNPNSQRYFGEGNGLSGVSIKIRPHPVNILGLDPQFYSDPFYKRGDTKSSQHITKRVAGDITYYNYGEYYKRIQ